MLGSGRFYVWPISEPEFYCDLVYKFKKLRKEALFFSVNKKINIRYKRIENNFNVMR